MISDVFIEAVDELEILHVTKKAVLLRMPTPPLMLIFQSVGTEGGCTTTQETQPSEAQVVVGRGGERRADESIAVEGESCGVSCGRAESESDATATRCA